MLLPWVNSAFLGETSLIINWTYQSLPKGKVQIPIWIYVWWDDYSILQEKIKSCNSPFILPKADSSYTAKYNSFSESGSSLQTYFFLYLWYSIVMLWAFLPFDEGSTCSPQPFWLSYSIDPCRTSLLCTCTPTPALQCVWRNETSAFVCLISFSEGRLWIYALWLPL